MSKPKRTKEYKVAWLIELPTCSPREAAELALEIQRDEGSLATVFRVTDPKTGKTVTIDLDEGKR